MVVEAQLANYLALIRLTPEKHGYMYTLAVESYDDIYDNIMSKGKTKLRSKFLGGNPVTLEKKDFPTLIKNEYMVSTKADGMRFLLMIGNKSEYEQRHIFFVDRNKDFWILVNNGQNLPSISNIPNCLLDGELMMWGDLVQNENIIRLSPYKKLKPLMIFSAFDILYGPTNPKFDGINANIKLDLGSSGAFMGPKGGYRWPWKKRYSVLSTMISNEFSTLKSFNKLEKEFRFKMVISPFIPLQTVLKAQNPYNYMKNVFEKGLKYQFPDIPSEIGHKTDGLILTPTNTEYLTDSWTFCGNDQFKWKPSGELTVDLRVGKKTKIYVKGIDKDIIGYKGYSRRGKKLVHVGYILNNNNQKLSGVIECLWLNDPENPNLFEYKNDRSDKKLPNAEKTVTSVIEAIKNPFSMKALKIVYEYGIENLIKISKTNKLPGYLNNVLQQLNTSFKIKCILDKYPNKLFTIKELESLKILVIKAQKNPYSELESRFKFPINLPYFSCLIGKLRNKNYVQPLPVLKTYGPNNERMSNVIIGDHYIKEESIIKTEINRIRFGKNAVMKQSNYNISYIDTVLSEERDNDRNNFKPKLFRYQVRYEVDPLPLSPLGRTPSVLWRLDITEYGESNKDAEQAKHNYEINPKTSIEIEYAPGDQENSVWKYYEDNKSPQNLLNIVNIFGLKATNNSPEFVKRMLDERVDKLFTINPQFVVNDYCKLVNWVLQLIYT